jgi:hypothetical protein
METTNHMKEFKPIPTIEKILWETMNQWKEFKPMLMAEKYYGKQLIKGKNFSQYRRYGKKYYRA